MKVLLSSKKTPILPEFSGEKRFGKCGYRTPFFRRERPMCRSAIVLYHDKSEGHPLIESF